ncbi:hypothetical protein DH2020_037294 [Rehmannia glutinosa]|uniref:Uncharacterized protein n=1 Tax=Rehmannia glutinosa TaxID=99300 RepID=A0ABR0V4F2_REHGL
MSSSIKSRLYKPTGGMVASDIICMMTSRLCMGWSGSSNWLPIVLSSIRFRWEGALKTVIDNFSLAHFHLSAIKRTAQVNAIIQVWKVDVGNKITTYLENIIQQRRKTQYCYDAFGACDKYVLVEREYKSEVNNLEDVRVDVSLSASKYNIKIEVLLGDIRHELFKSFKKRRGD